MVDEADQELWQKPTSSDDPVLALVKEGRVDAEIAVRLGLSNAEVKERIERLVAKHGVKNRAELREPPKAVVAEELVPMEFESVERETVSPVRAAVWAGAIALVVGLGVGWWIRDEQAGRESSGELVELPGPRASLSADDFRRIRDALESTEFVQLGSSTPIATAAELGAPLVGESENSVVDALSYDNNGHQIVTLATSTVLSVGGPIEWTVERRTTGELKATTPVRGKVVILRIESDNDVTRIDREANVVRISSTDGSKPRVKLWIDGHPWRFGLDGRLVVYL